MEKLAVALLALAAASPAQARKVGGVEFSDSASAGGKELSLNGAGVRKRFIVEVYAGGLYLAERSSDAGAILAADAPRRVRMVFLRDVDRNAILDAYRDGFRSNSDGPALPDLLARLDEIAAAIPGEMKKGREMTVTYVPGQGTTVTAEGGGSATVEGKDFADAMFRNWLGRKPADENLKKAMLGR